MKIVRWNYRFRVNDYRSVRSKVSSIDISNWKIIVGGTVGVYASSVFENIEGVLILVDEKTYFLPGFTLKKLFDFLSGPKTEIEYFIMKLGSYNLPLCVKCKGSGKIDWISKVTEPRKAPFVRDTSLIFQVVRRKIDSLYPEIFPNLFVSKAKLEEGFLHCPNCIGSGTTLNANYRLLQGHPQIKKTLKPFYSEKVYSLISKNESNVIKSNLNRR
ncbi:MAG: hypothetical protein ACFFG0_03800 [Candidatus Thorarchaeota archaeon]